jgi:hypothetical protein
MNDTEYWSNSSSIESASSPDHDGELCVDFFNPVNFVYMNKQDVINLAKKFELTEGDLK